MPQVCVCVCVCVFDFFGTTQVEKHGQDFDLRILNIFFLNQKLFSLLLRLSYNRFNALSYRSSTKMGCMVLQGGIEDGEDPKSAAMRELQEETSVVSAEIIAEVSLLVTNTNTNDYESVYKKIFF